MVFSIKVPPFASRGTVPDGIRLGREPYSATARTRQRIAAADRITARAHRHVRVGHHELIVIGPEGKPIDRRVHLLDQITGCVGIGIP